MIFRCYNPDRSECGCQFPCELSLFEMNKIAGRSTACPVGDRDYFYESDETSEFFLLIVGSRTYSDYTTFKDKTDYMLSKKHPNDIIIVSGGAKGVDSMAERYAREHHYKFICFPADWDKGASAGYKRNRVMHEYISKYVNRGVLAFWDGQSKGTAHSFDLAKEFHNPIKVIRV